MLKRFWQDIGGGVLSGEMVIAGAVLVIGLIVGLTALRMSILTEVSDVGKAVHSIDFTPTITPVPDTMTSSSTSSDGPVTLADQLGQ